MKLQHDLIDIAKANGWTRYSTGYSKAEPAFGRPVTARVVYLRDDERVVIAFALEDDETWTVKMGAHFKRLPGRRTTTHPDSARTDGRSYERTHANPWTWLDIKEATIIRRVTAALTA